MKKIVIAIILASFTTTMLKAAPKNTWYAGGKLSWSRFYNTDRYHHLLNGDNGLVRTSQLGAGAFGGYQINSHVGFEMDYDWLGSISYKGDINSNSFKIHGVQLTTKLNHRVIDNLDIYARLGSMVWYTDFSNDISVKSHDTGISPVFASGIEWTTTRDVFTRLEYQRVNNIGQNHIIGLRPNNSMLSLGVSYRFGQQGETPTRRDPSVVNPSEKIENKHFTLKSDVLFDFNQATLTPKGYQTLNQLLTQLSSVNLKDNSIVILGFTDRIGSNVYNLDLSEKRAQSVFNYLVSKGISKNKISLQGMGKSSPVTGDTCYSMRSHSTLIDCLSPDRRVEIQIKGVKTP